MAALRLSSGLLEKKLYLLFQSPSWVSKGPKSYGPGEVWGASSYCRNHFLGKTPYGPHAHPIQWELGDRLSTHCTSRRFLSSYSSNLTLCLSKSPILLHELLQVGTRVLAHLRIPNTCINSFSMHDKDSVPFSHLSMSYCLVLEYWLYSFCSFGVGVGVLQSRKWDHFAENFVKW